MTFTKYNNPSRKHRKAIRNDYTEKMIYATKNMILDSNNGYTCQAESIAQQLSEEGKEVK